MGCLKTLAKDKSIFPTHRPGNNYFLPVYGYSNIPAIFFKLFSYLNHKKDHTEHWDWRYKKDEQNNVEYYKK